MAKRKNRKPRGSSKAGRPRKAGERFPSGGLKPPGPNELTLAKRAIGDSSAGEHPLDFMLRVGWISERLHKAGMAYLAARQAACIGGPRLSSGALREAPEREVLVTSFAQLPDEEVAAIWDRVFNALPPSEQADIAALARWRALNVALRPGERNELHLICIEASWAFWMTRKAVRGVLGVLDQARHDALLSGLEAVAVAGRKPKATTTITAIPKAPSTKGKVEAPVNYISEDGEAVQPTSSKGSPFEVATLVRRVVR